MILSAAFASANILFRVPASLSARMIGKDCHNMRGKSFTKNPRNSDILVIGNLFICFVCCHKVKSRELKSRFGSKNPCGGVGI